MGIDAASDCRSRYSTKALHGIVATVEIPCSTLAASHESVCTAHGLDDPIVSQRCGAMSGELNLLIAALIISALNLIAGILIGLWIHSGSTGGRRPGLTNRMQRAIRTLDRIVISIVRRVSIHTDYIETVVKQQSEIAASEAPNLEQAVRVLKESQQEVDNFRSFLQSIDRKLQKLGDRVRSYTNDDSAASASRNSSQDDVEAATIDETVSPSNSSKDVNAVPTEIDGIIANLPTFDSEDLVDRIPFTLPVKVLALDKSMCMQGDVFFAVARDLSRGGMSFICEQPVTVEFVAIQLDAPHRPPVYVVMQVKRCEPCAAFYEVGGPFLERVTSAESIAKLREARSSNA